MSLDFGIINSTLGQNGLYLIPTIMIRYIPRNKFVIYLIPYTGYTFPILGGALHQRILISLNIPPCQIAEVH